MLEQPLDPESETGDEIPKIVFRPSIIVLTGSPLMGKTVLANELIKRSDLALLDVDQVRRELFPRTIGKMLFGGEETKEVEEELIPLLQGIDGPNTEKRLMIKCYTELCARARNIVQGKKPALLASTFSTPEFKRPLEKLYQFLVKEGIPFKVFQLTASDNEIQRRIEKRKTEGSFSNIDSLEKFKWAQGNFQRITFTDVVDIDSEDTDYVNQTFQHLEDLRIP